MRTLRVESEAEIDGNQLVGALADLGVSPSSFEWEFSKLEVGDFHMHFERPAEGGTGVAFSIHLGATHHDPHEHEHAGASGAHGQAGNGRGPHDHDDEHAHDHGHDHHPHSAGTAEGNAPAAGLGYDFDALLTLVENSDLSDRSKEISLGMLAQLATSAPAAPGTGTAGGSNALPEAELSLLAQTVLIAVGVDQLGIDRIEILQAAEAGRRSGSPGVDRPTDSLDPVIAAVQAVLPRGEPPAGLRSVKSGVGLPAETHATGSAAVRVFLFEG